jgi:hypothetical protein
MSDLELKRYIEGMKEFVDEKMKTITKEESRAALIRTGILDEQGNVTERYRKIITDREEVAS